MQLRIGVVNHIQPGGVLLQQTDTYRWADMFSCADKRDKGGGGRFNPPPFPPTFPFEEANFCHRAVTNAIKVMQFLLLAEREKSCLLTRMKDGAPASEMTKYSGSGTGFARGVPTGCAIFRPAPSTTFSLNFQFPCLLFFIIFNNDQIM